MYKPRRSKKRAEIVKVSQIKQVSQKEPPPVSMNIAAGQIYLQVYKNKNKKTRQLLLKVLNIQEHLNYLCTTILTLAAHY